MAMVMVMKTIIIIILIIMRITMTMIIAMVVVWVSSMTPPLTPIMLFTQFIFMGHHFAVTYIELPPALLMLTKAASGKELSCLCMCLSSSTLYGRLCFGWNSVVDYRVIVSGVLISLHTADIATLTSQRLTCLLLLHS